RTTRALVLRTLQGPSDGPASLLAAVTRAGVTVGTVSAEFPSPDGKRGTHSGGASRLRDPEGVAPLFGASPTANPVSHEEDDMPEREARARAVYDHNNEEPRPSGRRRRQVADWGVGEELFDGMPGRRFDRRPHRELPRGDAADGRRTIVIETEDGALPPERATPSDEEFASR